MRSEASALEIRPIAARITPPLGRPLTPLPTWTVRATRFVDNRAGEELLNRLLAKGSHDQILSSPAIARSGPIRRSRVLGSLYALRAPVTCARGRVSASGYVEVLPVGTGMTEVHICLRSDNRRSIFRRSRTLQELADETGQRLLASAGPPPPKATEAATPTARVGGE
jgi:hypothetical protein